MIKHEHAYIHTGKKNEDNLHEYKCACGYTVMLPKAEEAIISRSPIGVTHMEPEEQSVPELDPKKEAQRAKQAAYRQKRYQLKKAGQWNGHMPKP
jgi:hypothetical protein